MLYFILRPTASLENSTVLTVSSARAADGSASHNASGANSENSAFFMGASTPELRIQGGPTENRGGVIVSAPASVSRRGAARLHCRRGSERAKRWGEVS